MLILQLLFFFISYDRGLTGTSDHVYRYPIVHSIMLLPLSIVRWLSFSNTFRLADGQPGQPPLAATVTVEVIYGLFGVTNVALFLITRRRLLLFEHPKTVLHERGLDVYQARRSLTSMSSSRAVSMAKMNRIDKTKCDDIIGYNTPHDMGSNTPSDVITTRL